MDKFRRCIVQDTRIRQFLATHQGTIPTFANQRPLVDGLYYDSVEDNGGLTQDIHP